MGAFPNRHFGAAACLAAPASALAGLTVQYFIGEHVRALGATPATRAVIPLGGVLVITIPIAAFSCHEVGKPFLRLKVRRRA